MNKSKELVWRGGKSSKISSTYCYTSREETLLLSKSFSEPVVWDITSPQELMVWSLLFWLTNPEFCLHTPSLSPFKICGRWAAMICSMFFRFVQRELLFLYVWLLCICVTVEVWKVQNLQRSCGVFRNYYYYYFYPVASFSQGEMDEARTP